MIIWLVFTFVVLVIITAGVLLSKLAEISKEDKGKNTWVWGAVMIIAILVIPLLILSIIVMLIQYNELGGVFKNLIGL